MITTYFKTLRTKKFKKVDHFRNGSWINITHATSNDLHQLAELVGIDYEDLHDSQDLYEIPRLERQNGALLIFVRFPSLTIQGLHTEPMTIVVTDKYLVTISPLANNLISLFLEKQSLLATTQQSKLLFQLLLRLSREFTIKIKTVIDKVQKQKRNLEAISTKDIQFLIESEEVLNQYLSVLAPMENMCQTLLTGNYLKQYQEDKDLLEDVLIDISQSVNLCRVNLKSIVSLRDSYQIVFTNTLNKTIKFLTAFTVILTIPTVIGSLFGMNVPLPLASHPLAFSLILIITALLSIILFTTFYWKRWL